MPRPRVAHRARVPHDNDARLLHGGAREPQARWSSCRQRELEIRGVWSLEIRFGGAVAARARVGLRRNSGRDSTGRIFGGAVADGNRRAHTVVQHQEVKRIGIEH